MKQAGDIARLHPNFPLADVAASLSGIPVG